MFFDTACCRNERGGFHLIVFPSVVRFRQFPLHFFLLEACAEVAGVVIVVGATTPIGGVKAVAAAADCACKAPFSATQK